VLHGFSRKLQSHATVLVAIVVGQLGRTAGGRVVDQECQCDTTADRIVDNRFAVAEEETDLREAALDAVVGNVRERTALDVLVVRNGVAPATLVDAKAAVEDVVGSGLEVLGVEAGDLRVGEALGVDAVSGVDDLRDVDHGFVDAFDPVRAAVSLDSRDVVGFLWLAAGLIVSAALSMVPSLFGGLEPVGVGRVDWLLV